MNAKRINRMLNLVVIVALVLSWLPVTSATAISVSGAQAAHMLPVESLLNPDGTLNTITGASGALDLRGWSVTLDSARGPILTRGAPAAPAAPDAATWSALAHNGLNGIVIALAVIGNDLYVGGSFTQTADGIVKNLNNIAKYSGGTWSALAHNGLSGSVHALAVMGSDLYVGGYFGQTGDGTVTNLNHIAKYSGGTWSALAHSGLNCCVSALAVIGSDLYVGGDFTQTIDGIVTNLNGIAKYSGGAWSALAHNGLNEYVYALAVSGNDLYVGGYFGQTADGAVTNLNNIAKYSGGAWSGLPNYGLNGQVSALAMSGSDLYVGGNNFRQTGDGTVTNLNSIAKLGAISMPTNSRTVGAVTVYANSFSGTATNWTATGTVWIGNYTVVENATVTANGSSLTGSGLVSMISSADGTQLTHLFQDSFGVNTTNGVLTPQFSSGMIWQLGSLVGFAFQTPPVQLTINVLGGVTSGQVNLIFQIPGNVVPQAITFSLNHTGAVNGALVGTASFQLGGVQLKVKQASLGTQGLLIQSAALQLPVGLGGASAALSVNDARITSDGHLTLAGGAAAINFPNIHVGGDKGFGIEGAQAKLIVNNSSFEFQGKGTFVLPGVGAGDGTCKLGTSFTLSSTPPPIRQVSLSVSGCFKIPIGTTGFFITSVSGSFAMDETTVGIDLGLGVESGLSILNHNALSGDVDGHWDNSWAVGLSGNLKVFSFDVAQAALTLSQAKGLVGSIHISLVGVIDGQGQLHIWQDNNQFHMTGQADVSVGVKKGQIVNQCVGPVCLLIPPVDVSVGGASTDMGEFNVNGASVYGLKGQLSNFFGLQPAFFIDVQGDIQFDTNGLQQYQPASFALRSLADTMTQTWTVSSNTPALMVGLAFDSGTPTLTLIGPSQVITSGSPGIVVNTTVTQTVFTVPTPAPGLWQAQVDNLPPGATYVLAAFGARSLATIAPPIVSPNGNGTYTIGLLGSSAAPTSTLNLFFDTSPISHTGQLITTGLPLTTTSYMWQPTDIVSGTYYVYAMVDDPLGVPAYAYASMPLTITDITAPDTPLGLSATVDGDAAALTWQKSPAPDVAGYRLHWQEPAGGQTFVTDVSGESSTTYTQTGLYLNGDWPIAVSAYDVSGNESALSPAVVATITGNVPHASFNAYLPLLALNH